MTIQAHCERAWCQGCELLMHALTELNSQKALDAVCAGCTLRDAVSGHNRVNITEKWVGLSNTSLRSR